MSLTISYDSSSNITTGILNHENSAGPPLIFRLLATAQEFPHPMLLLVLVLEYWCHDFNSLISTCHSDLINVERQISLLQDELKQWHGESVALSKTRTEEDQGDFKKQGFNDGHGSLIVIHRFLMNPVSILVIDLATSILRGFD